MQLQRMRSCMRWVNEAPEVHYGVTNEYAMSLKSFNEELDGMFNDANLPLDEAWQAMSSDLSKTKEDRNRLAQENS